MKTLLGITTGFLAGTMFGIALTGTLAAISPELREFIHDITK